MYTPKVYNRTFENSRTGSWFYQWAIFLPSDDGSIEPDST